MRIRRAVVCASLLLLFSPSGWAGKYKTTARGVFGSFNYTAPSSSGSTTGQGLGLAFDMALGHSSTIGVDVNIGYDFSSQLVGFSQVNFLYKYFPWSYATVVVGGDAENKVSVRSSFYPYVGGGLGYSTLVVKANIPGTSVLATTNSQYFNLAFVIGSDYMLSDRWGLNFQTIASYGQGGTASGTLSAVGFIGAFGALYTF